MPPLQCEEAEAELQWSSARDEALVLQLVLFFIWAIIDQRCTLMGKCLQMHLITHFCFYKKLLKKSLENENKMHMSSC